MYTKMMLGPVSAIDLPEPRNRPVPMVPPMAMNWTWRFFRPRSISLLWSRLSTDLMCAALEPAELVFSEVIMFTTLPREPHIAPAEALFLGTYADFAALAHPVCDQPCPADHLIPVFSPRHTPILPYLAYIWQIPEVDRCFLAYIWHLLTAKHHLGVRFGRISVSCLPYISEIRPNYPTQIAPCLSDSAETDTHSTLSVLQLSDSGETDIRNALSPHYLSDSPETDN